MIFIEILLGISFIINLFLGFILLSSDNPSDLQVENKKLEMENIVLTKELTKLRELFHYLIDEDVRIDKSNDEAVIFYKKQEDNLEDIFKAGLGIK